MAFGAFLGAGTARAASRSTFDYETDVAGLYGGRYLETTNHGARQWWNVDYTFGYVTLYRCDQQTEDCTAEGRTSAWGITDGGYVNAPDGTGTFGDIGLIQNGYQPGARSCVLDPDQARTFPIAGVPPDLYWDVSGDSGTILQTPEPGWCGPDYLPLVNSSGRLTGGSANADCFQNPLVAPKDFIAATSGLQSVAESKLPVTKQLSGSASCTGSESQPVGNGVTVTSTNAWQLHIDVSLWMGLVGQLHHVFQSNTKIADLLREDLASFLGIPPAQNAPPAVIPDPGPGTVETEVTGKVLPSGKALDAAASKAPITVLSVKDKLSGRQPFALVPVRAASAASRLLKPGHPAVQLTGVIHFHPAGSSRTYSATVQTVLPADPKKP